MSINYDERIPNNVYLSSDRRLKRALGKLLPRYQSWWNDVGPQVFSNNEIFLRTAISTEAGGWANFGHVRMPEYRWGIFLGAPEKDRVIPGGDHAGKPVWQTVPGSTGAGSQAVSRTKAAMSQQWRELIMRSA